MQFQNVILALLATAIGTQALPQPVGELSTSTDVVLVSEDAAEMKVTSEQLDFARGVTVKFWDAKQRGCNTTPAFRTVQVPNRPNVCQRVNLRSIGSTMVTQNGMKKNCKSESFPLLI